MRTSFHYVSVDRLMPIVTDTPHNEHEWTRHYYLEGMALSFKRWHDAFDAQHGVAVQS